MRNSIGLILFISILSCGCSQPSLRITINNSHFENAILYISDTSRSIKPETLQIEGNTITLSRSIPEPTMFNLVVEGYNDVNRPIRLLLSSNTTELVFDSIVVFNQNRILDFFSNCPRFIKDPNNNAVLFLFWKEWATFYNAIVQTSNDGRNDSLLVVRKGIYAKFISKCDSIIKITKDQYISAFIINSLIDDNLLPLSKTQELFDYLSPEVKESFYGRSIGKEAGLAVGSPAPELFSPDLQGDTIILRKFQNKYVVLHFWSSSCGPCIKELPRLSKLSKNKKDLVVINVSLDTDLEVCKQQIISSSLDEIVNICDTKAFNGKIVKDYFIKYIPAYYIIDRSGKIIIKGDLQMIENELRKLLPD
jgi:thiol-disulfide isomerase/thioredoxin